MVQPSRLITSWSVPLASSFQIKIMSGWVRGSAGPAFSWNVTCATMGTACCARFVILWLDGVSSVMVAESSMYPSTPPFCEEGRWISTGKAGPNGMESGSLSGFGIMSAYGVGSLS